MTPSSLLTPFFIGAVLVCNFLNHWAYAEKKDLIQKEESHLLSEFTNEAYQTYTVLEKNRILLRMANSSYRREIALCAGNWTRTGVDSLLSLAPIPISPPFIGDLVWNQPWKSAKYHCKKAGDTHQAKSSLALSKAFLKKVEKAYSSRSDFDLYPSLIVKKFGTAFHAQIQSVRRSSEALSALLERIHDANESGMHGLSDVWDVEESGHFFERVLDECR